MNFGEKLIEVRKAKGLTQDEVAEMCNITTRTVQRIESGAVIPRAFTIKTISEALGFDFFEASNTGCEVSKENHHSGLKWYIKDLFNLKTNTMRKLAILTVSFLMIGFAVFALIPGESSKQNSYITGVFTFIPVESSNAQIQQLRPNFINTENLVEVTFSHTFTLDSLVHIQSELAKRNISVSYRLLEFDERGYLTSISAAIDTNDGFSGSFSADGLHLTPYVRYGFFRNFSTTARVPFGTGLLRIETDSERLF